MATLAEGEENVQLITLNGRTFRKRTVVGPSAVSLANFLPSRSKCSIFSSCFNFLKADTEDLCDEPCDLDIQADKKSGFFLKMELAPCFFPFLVGKKGNTKQRIEKDTGRQNAISVSLIIGKEGSTEPLTIKGPTRNSIINAYTRVEIVIETASKTLPYTHFLSIPLNMPTVRENATQFNQDLINEHQKKKIQGFDPSLLSQPSHLHITILMLKLFDQKQLAKAKSIISESAAKIYDLLGTRSLCVHLQDLEIMNDDPSDVKVVYLKVKSDEGDERLQNLVEYLFSTFTKAGLVDDTQEREFKAHVTLINTRFRAQTSLPTPLDGKPILSMYGKLDFGKIRLEALHLSERGNYGDDGYYKCVMKVDYP